MKAFIRTNQFYQEREREKEWRQREFSFGTLLRLMEVERHSSSVSAEYGFSNTCYILHKP